MTDKMSPRATARCRRIEVESNYKGKDISKMNMTIKVFDPKTESSIAEMTIRTRQDYFRILRAWMSKYRVPSENVSGDLIS